MQLEQELSWKQLPEEEGVQALQGQREEGRGKAEQGAARHVAQLRPSFACPWGPH